MTTKKIGVLAILVASLIWAIEPVIAKCAYRSDDYLQTLTIRSIVIVLIAFLYVRRTTKASLKISTKHLSIIIYIGLAGTVLAEALFFYSLTRIPVLNAVLIAHLQPIFIVLIGFFVLKEDKLTRYDYLGILIMIIAGLFITTRNIENLFMARLGTLGDFLVLLATLAWATTAILVRKYLTQIDVGLLVFYRFLVASVVFAAYMLSQSTLVISNIYQILLGVTGSVGYILYYEGLKRIKAAQASSVELTTPMFAAAFGFLLLDELITVMQAGGIILLAVGVYLVSKREEACL